MNRNTLLMAALLTGCGWDSMPDDDDGDAAWIAQVVPTVLGRNVRDMDELNVLVSIAQDRGRGQLVDLLMTDPDFDRYWTQVLVDGIQIPTDDRFDPDAILHTCFYPPVSSGPEQRRHARELTAAERYDIAGRLQDPAGVFGSYPTSASGLHDLRYLDLIRASVAYDRLDWAFVASVPVMQSAIRYDVDSERANRAAGANRFLNTFLGRDDECMACHTTRYSVTGGTNPHRTHDRHAPMGAYTPDGLADVESSLFSWYPFCATPGNCAGQSERVDGSRFGEEEKRQLQDLFHTGPYSDYPQNGHLSPWGMFSACSVRDVQNAPSGSAQLVWLQAPPTVVSQGTYSGNPIDVFPHFGDLHGVHLGPGQSAASTSLSSLDLAPYLLQGVAELRNPTSIEKPPAPMPLPPSGESWVDDAVHAQVHAMAMAESAGLLLGYSVYVEAYNRIMDEQGDDIRAAKTADWEANHLPNMSSGGNNCFAGCHQRSNLVRQDPWCNPTLERCDSTAYLANVPDDVVVQALRTVPQMTGICAGDEQCEVATVRWMRQQQGTDPFTGPGVDLTYDPPDELGTPAQSFAYLVAQQAVNIVFEEIAGERLVLAHGFPRNPDQAEVLGTLVETMVNEDWSLKAVVKQMVLSKAFNREAPDADADDPYVVATMADPFRWQERHIMGPGRFTTQGSLVHRASPELLTQKLGRALGWPTSWRPAYPASQHGNYSEHDYPRMVDLWDLGKHREYGDGVREVSLSNMLTWEADFATCHKPNRVMRSAIDGTTDPSVTVSAGDWDDWIDALLDEAAVNPMSRAVALGMIKERLVQDPDINPEIALVQSWWNVNLSDPVVAADETKLREFCSLQLKSPAFMLTGLPSVRDVDQARNVWLPERPLFRDEPRGLDGHCDHWHGAWDGYVCQPVDVVDPVDPELSDM